MEHTLYGAGNVRGVRESHPVALCGTHDFQASSDFHTRPEMQQWCAKVDRGGSIRGPRFPEYTRPSVGPEMQGCVRLNPGPVHRRYDTQANGAKPKLNLEIVACAR